MENNHSAERSWIAAKCVILCLGDEPNSQVFSFLDLAEDQSIKVDATCRTSHSSGDVFAVGDAFTAADATLIPIFYFFDVFARPYGTDKLLDAQPRLKAWWERAKASELGSRALAEQAAGLKAMMAGK